MTFNALSEMGLAFPINWAHGGRSSMARSQALSRQSEDVEQSLPTNIVGLPS
jgi:hypothetical protein